MFLKNNGKTKQKELRKGRSYRRKGNTVGVLEIIFFCVIIEIHLLHNACVCQYANAYIDLPIYLYANKDL